VGLESVNSIISTSGGRLVIQNMASTGARVSIIFADQVAGKSAMVDPNS